MGAPGGILGASFGGFVLVPPKVYIEYIRVFKDRGHEGTRGTQYKGSEKVRGC